MLSEIELETAKNEIKQAKSQDELAAIKGRYLGPQGKLALLMNNLKTLPLEQKREQGPILQRAKQELSSIFDEVYKKLLTGSAHKQPKALFPVNSVKVGHLHPITEVINQMNNLFMRMGYSIYESPEIETDEYNFQRLNVPVGHPAREMQDSLYIEEPKWLLRTQTSSIEARALAKLKPPFRIVCPGRTYRNEKANKSNHFIFHQYQLVVVQERVTLGELFGTIKMVFEELYGPDVVIRFRNKYYPEVEPGVGPDMRCFSCKGKGCAVCKNVGWIEMAGAGIIHEKVLKAAGIDTNKFMGYAFGLGLDRWIMAKYNISDIRTLLGGNLAFPYFEK